MPRPVEALAAMRRPGRLYWASLTLAAACFAGGMALWLYQILHGMGVATVYPENYGALLGAQRAAVPLAQVAEERGYSPDLCSYARSHIGSVLAPHLFLSLFGATLGPAGAVMMQYGGAWLIGIGLLTCIDVFGRYAIGRPLQGAFEVSELAMGALIFTSLPLVTMRGQHVTIDLLGMHDARGALRCALGYRDARAAWRYLVNQRGFKAEQIVVFGRSLGGAVAVETMPGKLALDSEVLGGTPYGASTIANADGSRQPSPKELKMARVQGERTAQIAAKLSGA